MRSPAFLFYYGWLVLAAGAVAEMLAQGSTSYAAGLFVLPLQSEFHISRANANSSILILFLGSALVSPFVGKMLDRYSIRLVVSLGALAFSGALAAIALTSSLWVMAALLFLPAAIGFMSIGPLTTSALASRWFYRRRGLALGLAAVATSGGGFVVVPLLSKAIQLYGWRLALIYEAGAICVIIIALALLVLRDNPADAGLAQHPENIGRRQTSPISAPHDGGDLRSSLRVRDILNNRAFWIPSLTLAAISGTCQAIIVTLVPYGVQLGFAVSAAAFFISAFAMAAGVTKVLAGLLADYIAPRLMLTAAPIFLMVSLLLLGVSAGYWGVLAGSCFAGISLGCALPTAAALIAKNFGSASFGGVMGWTYALVGVLAISETRLVGSIYDLTKAYAPAFAVFFLFSGFVLVAGILFKPRDAQKPHGA